LLALQVVPCVRLDLHHSQDITREVHVPVEPTSVRVNVYFSDFFDVGAETLTTYGAVNVSLLNDLPLFIDPFLLFNSDKPEYRLLHSELLKYLRFLRDKASQGPLTEGLLRAWLTFSEVKQTWLGFSLTGNSGRGLGLKFARRLAANLATVFSTFGEETVTKSSHLEKLCLLDDRVGQDLISDFTTNLIKRHLLEFTETFALKYLQPSQRRLTMVRNVFFNYDTESWVARQYELPWHSFVNDYVVLTPRDMLTRIDTWINRADLIHSFGDIVMALPNDALRDQVNSYFRLQLPPEPKKKDEEKATVKTILEFPLLLEWYIKLKEDQGDAATKKSAELVDQTVSLMIKRLGEFIIGLEKSSEFYRIPTTTLEETRQRVLYLKDTIENKGGHRLFWVGNQPVRKESDVQIMFRLTWFATPSTVTSEANDGRGPVDYKISRSSQDITLVEFKLASNKHLRANLQKQVEIYKKASDAKHGLKVIVFFTDNELATVRKVLKEVGLEQNGDVILIDARADNKPSGSKAA
jgi:hypothetical protein